jgi:hypothetical protein
MEEESVINMAFKLNRTAHQEIRLISNYFNSILTAVCPELQTQDRSTFLFNHTKDSRGHGREETTNFEASKD